MADAPKTLPSDAAFLDAVIPARRRDDGIALAGIFREVTGADPVLWGPPIVGFGSCRTRSGVWPKTGFSPRKAQLSLYGLKDLPEGADPLPRLGVYTEGAGCI